MGEYDGLFVKEIWDSSDSFAYEGEAVRDTADVPANLGHPYGLMRPAEVPQAQVHICLLYTSRCV